MRFALIALLLVCSCDQGLKIGDPCYPTDGWCCLDTEHVACENGFVKQVHPTPDDHCICVLREPGFRPCS